MPHVLFPFVIFAAAVVFFTRKWRRIPNLPPGPPGDPLIGNLRDMPTEQSSVVFHDWAKEYGDVMYLQVLGQSMVILDSRRAATDILEKRSANYSDRPKFALYRLLGWEPTLTFLPYGKQFFKHRQMHQAYLGRHECLEFRTMQTEEAHVLVKNLMSSSPGEHEMFLSRYATGVIVQIVAGHQITSNDDPYLRISDMVLEAMGRSGPPGSTPVDAFPILQHFPSWFPGCHYVGVARRWRPTLRELHEYPLTVVQRDLNAGTAKPSFLSRHLEEMDDQASPADYEDLKGAAATMFGAGEQTTWSTLSVFVLAMILHPECQARAQEEIDSVVGPSRMPEFYDRESLPYVEGLLQETMRWNPAVPLGVPHRSMADDTYRGMFIPKGTYVFANIRGISLDEAVYSDPHTFSPERYLPKPAGKGEPHFDFVYGFGRRICTGQYLADGSLWIAIASILATLSISNALDEHGNKIVPTDVMSDGLTSHPNDFTCVISPRSAQAELLALSLAESR